MENLIKQFIENNRIFSVNSIDVVRDGGTVVLESYTGERLKFYIHKDDYTLHTGYPVTKENKLTDLPTIAWLCNQVDVYLGKQMTEVQFVNMVKIRLSSVYNTTLKK
jgi:hypothetical protein